MENQPEQLNESSLIEKLLQKEKSTFDYVFKKYYTELCRYGLKITGNEEVTEEIVQDIFVYVWEKGDQLNIQTNLKGYLLKAVKNRSINYLKSQLANQHFEEIQPHTMSDEVSGHSEIENSELELIIKRGINQLPNKCQLIFKLSRHTGLTYEEISKELNISKKTVEAQMGIALKKLRSFLEIHWDKILFILFVFEIMKKNNPI
ncbi:RNA polymerase sigma-70 factor [Flexithrix dorotheae]|uniref:RNA polymerase sigma-70 factor n=1 Tax=Flexithrix dorotheae TaxID=70993 RepID=UPI0003690C07|nr:RNA polymerase sigma-70 factor [Flexithrix dorotheae]